MILNCLGNDSSAIKNGVAIGFQCVSGTGAIRVGADFLQQHLNCSVVFISDPSWPNHVHIFKAAGFVKIKSYRYWNEENKDLNCNGMVEDLKNAPENAVVVLHGCAHNPTGYICSI